MKNLFILLMSEENISEVLNHTDLTEEPKAGEKQKTFSGYPKLPAVKRFPHHDL